MRMILLFTACAGLCFSQTPLFYQSSTSNGNLPAANLLANTGGNYGYQLNWQVELTTPGVGCTGTTTVVLNVIVTSPNATSATTLPLMTIPLASNGNGTVGPLAGGPPVTLYAQIGTAIQISTTNYAAGTGCTVNPIYQVQAWLSPLSGSF